MIRDKVEETIKALIEVNRLNLAIQREVTDKQELRNKEEALGHLLRFELAQISAANDFLIREIERLELQVQQLRESFRRANRLSNYLKHHNIVGELRLEIKAQTAGRADSEEREKGGELDYEDDEVWSPFE